MQRLVMPLVGGLVGGLVQSIATPSQGGGVFGLTFFGQPLTLTGDTVTLGAA